MSRWCVGSARGSPTSRPTFCRCRLSEPAARPLLVSVCNRGETRAARRGQRAIMRLLPPLIAAALTTLAAAAAAAAADEPPASTPLTLSAPAAGSDLPDMGSPAAAVLSHTDEYRLGAMVARELRDQNALLEDPEVSEYMSWVGLRLASQSAEGGRGFQYFVIKDPGINAFAVPGGFVFVNDGLVLATSSESELASVMAHETAHVTQHHIARMIRD